MSCKFFCALRQLLAITFLISATPLFAQYGAAIEGTVSDQTGAVVAGATVTAKNEANGVSRSTTTGDSGFYRIVGLTPGSYTVSVAAQSFPSKDTSKVVIGAEAVSGLDVTLQSGSNKESVTVSAEAGGLESENANVSNTVTSREIVNLPSFGRDPYELLRLTPGVFADSARQANGNSVTLPQQVGPGGSNAQIFQTENQVQAVANGQRVTANNFTLDGVSVNSLDWGGAAVVTPNEESVQEIVVSSNSYSAQEGRNSGAQVKAISKYGTNDFHGSAFFKINDKGLNAFNKYYGSSAGTLPTITCEGFTPSQFTITANHCPTRVDQKYRDFAGSVGGPLFTNRLFFFASYEGVRLQNTTVSRDVKLETPEFEQYVKTANPGSLAAQIFNTPGIAPRISTEHGATDCCSLIPGYGLGRWYLPGIGAGQAIGNGPDGIPDWAFFDLKVPNSSRGDQFNGRIDYTQGNNQFFVGTYIVRLNNVNGGQRPLEDLTLKPSNYVGTVGWNRTINATMLNEFRANYTRFSFDQRQPTGLTDFGIPAISLFDFDAGGLGDIGTFIGVDRSGTTPELASQNTYALADTLSWIRNKHAFKFGVEARREQKNDDQPGGERPFYQFRGLLNFANDACCFDEQLSVDPVSGLPPNSSRHFRTSDYALFIQDDWKITPTLTINLGLRWEYFTPLTEVNNLLTNYVAGSQGFLNGSVQPTKQLYSSDKNNFGPRIGFAWSPAHYQSKVVFRGGFGLLYNRHFGVIFDNVRQNTPFSAEVNTCCFFDNGTNVGSPAGSNILYSLGASRQANSFPVNPAFAFGVAPDGALCADAGCTAITTVDLFGALPKEPNPYVYVYSFETQVEVMKNTIFKMGYQGSRSRKLVRTIDVNRLIPGDTFDGLQDKVQNSSADGVACGPSNPACLAAHPTGNDRFQSIFIPLPDVNASYDAGVFHLTRNFAHGFQIDGIFTWSHAIDTSSYEVGFQQTDPGDQALNRGDSDYDVRRNFVLSAYWELPVFRNTQHGLLHTALGGWTLSSIMSKHSGFPFSALIGSCDTNNDRNGDGYCPDLPSAYFGGAIANASKQQWMNGIFPSPPTEFDIDTKGPGCRCRNIFTGPGYTSVDLTIGKDFDLPKAGFLGEGSKLAIRANFFNVFNILNLNQLTPASSPTDILNSGDFGRATDGLAGRVIEFQARLSF